jgi:hypothetical protein
MITHLQDLLKRASGVGEEGEFARVLNLASEFAGNLRLDDPEFVVRPYSAVTAYMQVAPARARAPPARGALK